MGRFELKVDGKGRFSLPSTVKSIFNDSPFVVTNSQHQGHRFLDIYLESEWKCLEARVQKMSSLNRQVQAFQRFYMAGGQKMQSDSQGRCLVPRSLREYAQIHGEVILVGMGNKFELWQMDVWKSVFENLASGFEETLESIAALDMGA